MTTESLVVQTVARAQPMELSVLDVMGGLTDAWYAVLYDAQTGRVVERFSSQGVLIPYCLGDPSFDPLAVPVGDYDLFVWPEEGSFMLPTRAPLHLLETAADSTSVQFPGYGGFVRVECEGLTQKGSRL